MLKKCRFPLAGYTKAEVRAIARTLGLPVAEKPESQDICFIPDGGLQDFLAQRISPAPGDIVDRSGRVLGRHRGLCLYTIGQRQGLGISAPRPLYVTDLDPERNRVVAGGKEHLAAFGLVARRINMFTDAVSGSGAAKIRYGHAAQACRYQRSGQELTLWFERPQEAITPGQSAVLYEGDTVLGGGIIERAFI